MAISKKSIKAGFAAARKAPANFVRQMGKSAAVTGRALGRGAVGAFVPTKMKADILSSAKKRKLLKGLKGLKKKSAADVIRGSKGLKRYK